MIFQGLYAARNCLRPKTAPLTVLAIKRGILCNFKPFFAQSFKNMVKISILDLQKRGYFSQILLYFQSPAIFVSQSLTT